MKYAPVCLNMMMIRLKRAYVEVVPPELEEKVRQAAAECDPGAIMIEE